MHWQEELIKCSQAIEDDSAYESDSKVKKLEEKQVLKYIIGQDRFKLNRIENKTDKCYRVQKSREQLKMIPWVEKFMEVSLGLV